jgi:indolepyruvate ferredoxin oxidoreductase alpha subunit
MVLPVIARKNYDRHLGILDEMATWAATHEVNELTINPVFSEFAVITTGLARNYFEENVGEILARPSHLHIGAYPVPAEKIRQLLEVSEKIVVLEEGQPFVETRLRGFVPPTKEIIGKIDGMVPSSGELNPDNIRSALGLPPVPIGAEPPANLPGRPPQLCAGCPHDDTFLALKEALENYDESLVTSDIGCYTLGYLPPHRVIETALCMGASIPMARGAADAGMRPVVATIGDSTFMHSGLTGLADVAARNVPMTIIIMDNETTAMTGGQDTIVSSPQLKQAVLGLGVDPDHVVELSPVPKNHQENTAHLKREIAYEGLSVVIAVRECVVTLKARRAEARLAKASISFAGEVTP